MPQVTPTDLAMAEWPFGSPRSSSVEVIVSCPSQAVSIAIHHLRAGTDIGRILTRLPSCHSTTNLCWSITKSLSPGWKLMSNSSSAQRVSKRLPRRVAALSVNRPIHLRPEMIFSLSASSEKLHSSSMREVNELGSRQLRSYNGIKALSDGSLTRHQPRLHQWPAQTPPSTSDHRRRRSSPASPSAAYQATPAL